MLYSIFKSFWKANIQQIKADSSLWKQSKLIFLCICDQNTENGQDLTIAFGMQNSAYRDILGDEHWYAVLRNVGMPGLSEILQGLLQHANILVRLTHNTKMSICIFTHKYLNE